MTLHSPVFLTSRRPVIVLPLSAVEPKLPVFPSTSSSSAWNSAIFCYYCFSLYCNHLAVRKNQSFRNNSANPNRFGPTLVHRSRTGQGLKERQCSRTFGSDRPNGARWGLGRLRQSRIFFCRQNEMTFRQLPNLALTRESMSQQNVSQAISDNFPFSGHFVPQNHRLKGSSGQTDTLL